LHCLKSCFSPNESPLFGSGLKSENLTCCRTFGGNTRYSPWRVGAQEEKPGRKDFPLQVPHSLDSFCTSKV